MATLVTTRTFDWTILSNSELNEGEVDLNLQRVKHLLTIMLWFSSNPMLVGVTPQVANYVYSKLSELLVQAISFADIFSIKVLWDNNFKT